MRRFLIYLLIVMVISLVGCDGNTQQKGGEIERLDSQQPTTEPPKSTSMSTLTSAQESTPTPTQFNEYSNTRYGFSIKYPSEWRTGEESDNGDGKILYVGNQDVDIRVYASNYLEGISDPYHQKDNKNVQLQKIKLDNGKESTLILGKHNNKVLYEMVYISKQDVEYHFYANISEKFFQDNEKVLFKVAKSMDKPE